MLKLNNIFSLRHIFKQERHLITSQICLKKRRTREEKKTPKQIVFTPKSLWKETQVVDVWRNMTMKELAESLGKDHDHILEAMSFIDNTAHYRKPNQTIEDFKVIQEVVKKSGKRWKMVPKEIEADEVFQDVGRRQPSEYLNVKSRPAVVTIMGHVDHGKTTLLDHLRKSSIVEKEFGGITQHIGAFSVQIGKDIITFLDTPGHAAFCSMRSRGAQCTDIVILVVAADDGVMEQTVESINMAKEANVPIIVAINKIDKPQADIERTKKMLVQHGIQVEDYGGDIQVVPISALKGTNVSTLIDAVLVQAELMELKSDYSGPVEAVVIECMTDLRGKLCTILVEVGTLKKGAVLIADTAWCKIRAMFDEKGEPVTEATPSTPVQTLGWRELPSAGDVAIQVDSERHATSIIKKRQEIKDLQKSKEDAQLIEKKNQEHNEKYHAFLEMKRKMGRFRIRPDGPRQKLYQNDEQLKLNVIIKGDVDGSVEAILDVLDTYENPICKLNLVHFGVGAVTKNDTVLAESFNAVIYAFNTKVLPDANYKNIKHFNVIYKLIDDVKSEINKLLPEKDEEEILGEATVLQEFIITDGKTKIPVAGCRCIKGHLKKSLVRVIRSNETIYSGHVESLRHLKDEVDTIKKDLECGLRIDDKTINFKPGDTIVCYKINKVPQTLDWDPGF